MYKELNVENYWNLHWLDQFLTGTNGIIAGGCFKNILNNKPVKDIDIFFRNSIDWDEAVQYYDSRCVGYEEDYEDLGDSDPLPESKAEYRFQYENSKVKAYKHIRTGIRVELCCAVYGSPEEILDNFDFSITKFAYYKQPVQTDEIDEVLSELVGETINTQEIETRIICHEDFFEHLHLNRLVLDNNIPYPMSTFERAFRYKGYGYNLCKESKIKLIKALRNVPEETVEVSASLYDGLD